MKLERAGLTRTIGNPAASRWLRRIGTKVLGSQPATKRTWQVAVARPGIALTGLSGLPVRQARISKVFQA